MGSRHSECGTTAYAHPGSKNLITGRVPSAQRSMDETMHWLVLKSIVDRSLSHCETVSRLPSISFELGRRPGTNFEGCHDSGSDYVKLLRRILTLELWCHFHPC